MQNLHPAIAEALRPFAPPRVSCDTKTLSSGALLTFRGKDADEVYEAALSRKNAIDIYRSPAVVARLWDGDEYVVQVRYYGLD
ncbi:hypothetical protein NDR89_23270 [Cupriavidus gilardii]|uniref:KTSC domain-containing protein n=1 Tax=Cupriavidus gilardii TaxID=82541 RepID=A0ABY4VXL8_9BURK|nr:hypothetical protein [Cupriavidus gilardii]USE79515.1 hypothetical protein NDR89_23270 [Cupriavidus gilardii]